MPAGVCLNKEYAVELAPTVVTEPVTIKVPPDVLIIPRVFTALPAEMLPVIVNDDVADIVKQIAPATAAVDKLPIIVAAFDCDIVSIEPVELIIVGEVIVTPLLII